MKTIKLSILAILFLFLFTSCSSDDDNGDCGCRDISEFYFTVGCPGQEQRIEMTPPNFGEYCPDFENK